MCKIFLKNPKFFFFFNNAQIKYEFLTIKNIKNSCFVKKN